jgi:hypothetical protein
MKLLSVLILTFICNACSNRVVDVSFIPKEFDYPNDKIESGKTFIYKNTETNEETFKDIKIVHDKDQIYRTVKSYDSHSVSDSAIIFNGRTIALYNFFMSGNKKVIKGEKLQDTVIFNNEKLGTHLTKWIYRTDDLLYTTTSEEKFIKDTFITWENHQLPCLAVQKNGNISLQVINSPAANHQTRFSYKLFFAEGIGLIKFSIEFEGQKGKYNGSWDLISIKETP